MFTSYFAADDEFEVPPIELAELSRSEPSSEKMPPAKVEPNPADDKPWRTNAIGIPD